jgi:hypothetical protein
MIEFLSFLIGILASAFLGNYGVSNATLLAFAALIVTYLILLYIERKNSEEDYFEPEPWNRINFTVFIGFSILCHDWFDFFFKGSFELPLFILGALSFAVALLWGGLTMSSIYLGVFVLIQEIKHRKNPENQEIIED